AFMPILMLKFQGGDFQIEPYNVFAFVFLMGAFAYALRKNTRESSLLLLAAVACSFLGSNLASLVLFVFSLAVFCIGIARFVHDTHEGEKREKTLAYFIGAIILCEALFLAYYIRAGAGALGSAKTIMPYMLIPLAAFACAWLIVRIFSDMKKEGAREPTPAKSWHAIFDFSPGRWIAELKEKLGVGELKLDLWSRLGVLAVIAMLGMGALLVAQGLPIVGGMVKNYVLFGAYSEPLYRTIAEQAPGSQYYSGQIGFLGAPLTGLDNTTGVMASAYSLSSSAAGAINAIPNALVNLVYGIFIAVMNSISGVDTFEKVDKGNSLLTLLVFWGIAALFASLIYSIYKKRAIGLDALLVLPFAVPVVLMAFGKAKLVMYLALAMVFLAGVFWGNLEKAIKLLLRRFYPEGKDGKGEGKERHAQVITALRALCLLAVFTIILLEFAPAYTLTLTLPDQEQPGGLFDSLAGSYGYGALPLFVHSFEPRVYDNEQTGLAKLEKYCALAPQDSVCTRVQNWNSTINDPVAYYEYGLCARSLWPYADKSPPIGVQVAMGYRCSFVAPYWLDSMQWIRNNVPAAEGGSRVISWWDYGHWINFFGEKNTVLRNEHASTEMIGRTAYAFLDGDAKFLRDTMKKYDSRYLLVDIEILGSGSDSSNIQLGGKYSALNYLGCAWANQTSVEKQPGQSLCENAHIWETVAVPQTQDTGGQPCTISSNRGLHGITGYSLARQPDGSSIPSAKYCFAQEYENGQATVKAYLLDKRDTNGDLMPVDAQWKGYSDANGLVLTPFYYNEIPDDAAAFYRSNIYTAFFLNSVEGFDLVYSSPQVRIFRMRDEYWNGGN
ncbi:MAG: hypothetical protein V1822_01835, partial [Candidatus Micrarchaeota archaeon]